MSIDYPAGAARRRVHRDEFGVASFEQRCGVDRNPSDSERSQRYQQPLHSGLARDVAGNCAVWPFAEDLGDELAEDAARSCFDEDSRTRSVHALDLLDEADRLRDLIGQERERLFSVAT